MLEKKKIGQVKNDTKGERAKTTVKLMNKNGGWKQHGKEQNENKRDPSSQSQEAKQQGEETKKQTEAERKDKQKKGIEAL